ncbi:MAG: type II toxin-antitoxin system VapC family toxin [Thermoguttaceae bacterium]
MTVFDTDVFVEILMGNARFVERAAAVPVEQQAISVVTVEEILRGRLHAVRKAEASREAGVLERAYELLIRTVNDCHRLLILPYTPDADSLYRTWREQRVRVSTHDLRIAAICRVHGASLASRNRRDFERIPGLDVTFWT